MNRKINKDYFAKARVGLFTHYTYATYNTATGTDWGGTHYSAADPRADTGALSHTRPGPAHGVLYGDRRRTSGLL